MTAEEFVPCIERTVSVTAGGRIPCIERTVFEASLARFVACVLALVASGCGSNGNPSGPDGARVDGNVTDGAITDGWAPDAQVPTPCESAAGPVIETVGTMSVGRYAPAGAVLADGRVLAAGGYDFAAGIQQSAEIFDPGSNTLASTGELALGRNFATATLMTDGTVLVVGGFRPSSGSTPTAELYDPVAGVFLWMSEYMDEGREAHTATLLPDGRVLAAGGLQAAGFVFHSTAEIFDPATSTFTRTSGDLASPRAFHAAVRVDSVGSVLLVGGDSGQGHLATAERYEIASDRFVPVSNDLPHPAGAPAAVVLDDGGVLVTGGANPDDGTLADANLYDPATDGFTPVTPMAVRRMAHQMVRLADGRVLAVGGWSDSSTPSASTPVLEVYDPAADRWETLSVELDRPRHDLIAFLMDDCRVFIAGGQQVVDGEPPLSPVEVEVLTVPIR